MKAISIVFALVAGTTPIAAQVWEQLGADIDGEAASDRSGASVSLSADGSRLAIGAPENDGNGYAAGHVRIYECAGGNWVQLGADIDGAERTEGCGYAVSLSRDGNRVAIGAPSAGDYERGITRIFEYAAGNWVQLGADLVGEARMDLSGSSVSLSSDGTRVAIGAPGGGGSVGAARIFEYVAGNWVQLGADIDGEAVRENLGTSVSLSSDGTRVAIGVPFFSASGIPDSWGRVEIYEFAGGKWVQLGADIDGQKSHDHFGWSVSLSSDGSRVAIGAKTGGENYSGLVRLYEYTDGSWVQLGADIVGEGKDNESFGFSVSLSSDGGGVAIGDLDSPQRVYIYDGGSWTQIGSNIDNGAESGWSVSLSSDGSRLAIGTPHGFTGELGGRVRVYELDLPPLCFSRNNLQCLTVSSVNYTLLSAPSLFAEFDAVTNFPGTGMTNSIPIDFNSPQRFYKYKWSY